MRVELSAAFLVIALTACSDSGSGGSDTGGSAGTGGTSAGNGGSTAGTGGSKGGSTPGGGGSNGGTTGNSAGTAGSSGASGTAVRGALSLNILAPDGCSLTEHYQDFPKVDSGHPVTATEKGGGVADGEMIEGYSADVVCRWSGNAEPYTLSAAFELRTATGARGISFGSTIAVGQPDDGSIVVESKDLPAPYHAPCTFTPIEVDGVTHSLWVSFTCDTFEPFDAADPCAVGPSYYYFENCTAP